MKANVMLDPNFQPEIWRKFAQYHTSAEWFNEVNKLFKFYLPAVLNKKFTEPPTCMPDECKISGDVVESYRKYYIMKKKEFATWKEPAYIPMWFKEGLANANI